MKARLHVPDSTPLRPRSPATDRREFLCRFGMGFGGIAAATMLAELDQARGDVTSPLAARPAHFAGTAKRVIHIFCAGGPSHVDTWDPKPALHQWEGKTVPALGATPLPSPFRFTKRGEFGIEVSELFPNVGQHVDKLAVLRALHTDTPEHQNATLMMMTGSGRLPKPSVGSWVLYGLGTENQNLPGYISIGNGGFGRSKCWSSGFLPSVFQGTNLRRIEKRVERMIENIRNPVLDLKEQREQLDLVQVLNRHHLQRSRGIGFQPVGHEATHDRLEAYPAVALIGYRSINTSSIQQRASAAWFLAYSRRKMLVAVGGATTSETYGIRASRHKIMRRVFVVQLCDVHTNRTLPERASDE